MRLGIAVLAALAVVLGAAALAAASAPSAVTGAVTGLGTSSATVTGTVNPNGESTTWFFEYGKTAGYGSQTGSANAGSGRANTTVSATITGLAPATTYHYRFVAVNNSGTTRGSDGVFTTAAAPSPAPTAVTGNASSVGSSGARLHGSVNSQGQPTMWHFEYGTTTGYGSSTPTRSAGSGTRTTGVSAPVSGLASGVTYHYRLVATNASGTTAGGDRTFTTVGAPVAQTGEAQGVDTTTATLNGSVDPRGRATSWYFEYGTSTRYGSRTPARSESAGSGNHAVTAGVPGLTPATTYHFRLVATSTAGTSRGADASFTTLGSVTLTHVGLLVVYGHGITLSGVSDTGRSGLQVTVLAQKYGETSFATVASVPTGAGGAWSYLARPTIRTTYVATTNGVSGPATTIGVRPAVSLVVGGRGRVSTRVRAGRSFAGRVVQLQRRSGGKWTTVKRARLNGTSAASFAADALPSGRSTIRIAMSVNQAGAGYLAGFSRTAAYRR